MYIKRLLAMTCAAALVAGGTCAYMKPEWDANRIVVWREDVGSSSMEGVSPIEIALIYGLNAKEQPVAAYIDVDASEDLGAESAVRLFLRYVYDRAGNPIASQGFATDGRLDMERKVTYDAYGNPLLEEGPSLQRHAYVYDARGRILKDSIYETEDGVESLSVQAEYTYTDHPDGGYTVESREESLSWITLSVYRVTTYDAQDRPILQDFTINDSTPRHVTYDYDNAGRQTELAAYEDSVLQERTITEYDVDGLYSRSTTYDGTGKITAASTSRLLDGPPV